MARIAGINIPVNKHTVIALTSIYGIGRTRAKQICTAVGIQPDRKIKDLTEGEVESLRTEVGKYTVDLCACQQSGQRCLAADVSAKHRVVSEEKQIAAFGVETMSPGVRKVSNREVHYICGELGFTHYENMINLHQLIDRGRFRFIAFPLKFRRGSGSPVRAVAVFED